MSTDKMREEFEAWLSRTYGKHMIAVWDEKSQTYNRLACTIALEAWVESRAAIELELPAVSDYFDKSEYPHTCDLLECDLRISIEYHGLKVKP